MVEKTCWEKNEREIEGSFRQEEREGLICTVPSIRT